MEYSIIDRLDSMERKIDRILSLVEKSNSKEENDKRMNEAFAIDVAANILVRMLPEDKVNELSNIFKQ